MKNAFVLTHVIAAVLFLSALAAELAGILPGRIISLGAFMGFYVVAAVLALAFEDYNRGGARTLQAAERASLRREREAAAAAAVRTARRPVVSPTPAALAWRRNWTPTLVQPAAPRTRA